MKWNELQNLTWNDAHNFTWGDLSLDKYELIAKSENGSIQLPADIQLKLRSLCTELSDKVPERKSFLSNISLKSVHDASKIFVNLVLAAKALDDMDIALRIKRIYDFIQSLLK